MAVTEGPFTGQKTAVTNGKRQVTFDTPSDFADWADRLDSAENLSAWHWVPAVLVVSDN
jgi:hypothetical protein